MSGNDALQRLQAALTGANIDAIALTPGSTLRYVTGHAFEPSERLTLVFIPREGEPVAALPNIEETTWRDNVAFETKLLLWDDASGPGEAVAHVRQHLGAPSPCAIERGVMRVFELDHLQRALPESELLDAEPIVLSLRAHKQPYEIEAMRRAIQIAESALDETLRIVKTGVEERAIASRLSSLLLEGGGEGISFGPIVLSGPKAALPHGVPGERAIQRGELLLIDFGTSYGGYHCDITRTFVVGAEPDALTRRVYESVRLGNERGCAKAGPGVSAHDVHHAAQDHLYAGEFDGYFRHRTGHGLGLDVHEPPSIMDGNPAPLEPGHVFTVEPGLYREGWGGVRIEDDVLITDTGAEILTTFPRELRVL